MRNSNVMLLSALILLLAGSLAWANATPGEITWDFTVSPSAGGAEPGGVVTFDYTLTNYGPSTLEMGPPWWVVDPGAVIPQTSVYALASPQNTVLFAPPYTAVSGGAFMLIWKPTAPIGFSGPITFTYGVANQPASPGQSIERTVTATVTPELPPGALGLLSFVPYGLWRLRMRKKK